MGDYNRSTQYSPAIFGPQGAPAGFANGYYGSITGQIAGPAEGQQRAAIGGMEGPSPGQDIVSSMFPSPTDTTANAIFGQGGAAAQNKATNPAVRSGVQAW